MKNLKKYLGYPLIWLIRFYKLAISPWIGPKCRYTPSCSSYSEQAIRKYGPIKGLLLSVKRISKCHPWGGSGYDPVP